VLGLDNGSITPSSVEAMTGSTSAALPDDQPVSLSELGVLGVDRAGRWSAVRGTRTLTLLAALGLAGPRGVGTEELVEEIWPSPGQPATARQSLANLVLRLRRAYGETFVESTLGRYRLGGHVTSDREHFVLEVTEAEATVAHAPNRALGLVDRALGRWRGDPWAGLERPVGVEADRAHLTQVHVRALRTRATALVALTRNGEAEAVLRELLTAAPHDEWSRHRLVRVLTETGQRAEALRSINEARRVFSERGLAIDASLADVERRLLNDEFAFVAHPEPLPEQPTEFIGRHRETEEIISRLHIGRLVTLHGLGGSGKTRLAVQAAAAISEVRSRGFVDLVGAQPGSDVDLAFARGLGLPVTQLDGLDTDQRRATLADAAAASDALLVVDNCEHVLDDVRAVVSRLLARPGRLRMLATSRVPLALAGEYRFPIPRYTAGTELFARRAAQHGVSIDPDQETTTVADICDLVDQLPLAIEIAAAQTPYRTVEEIADELRRGITQRDGAQPAPRHETMAATIRWSHELLDPAVAASFVRLGVFATMFQRNDAEAVMGSGHPSEALDVLVRSSLVERHQSGGRSFHRLAAPVQQYCAAELERLGNATAVGVALGDWLLEFTDRPDGDVFLRFSVIDEIEPRFRLAIDAIAALRAVGRDGDATRLGGRLGTVAMGNGHADELLELLDELVPTCDDPDAVADALTSVVRCAESGRRNDAARRALDRLRGLDGEAGRRHRVYVHCFDALWLMWTARMTNTSYQAAHDELQLARDATDAHGSPIDHAQVESWQSALHLLDGDWHAAETSARRSLRHAAGTHIDLDATLCLCHARLHLGDPDDALRLATGHPDRERTGAYGERLGMAQAIALVQRGDVDLGVNEISRILDRARRHSVKFVQDDTAVAVAYIAHLSGHEDLARELLDTGVAGRGPWIGHLVPKMCRELGIELTGHYIHGVDERLARSDRSGGTAARVLAELHEREARRTAHAPPR